MKKLLLFWFIFTCFLFTSCPDDQGRGWNWKNGLHINTPTATPAFIPDPAVLAWVNAQRPWLEAKSTDPNIQPGAAPATTFLISGVEPIVTRDGNNWKITFKP